MPKATIAPFSFVKVSWKEFVDELRLRKEAVAYVGQTKDPFIRFDDKTRQKQFPLGGNILAVKVTAMNKKECEAYVIARGCGGAYFNDNKPPKPTNGGKEDEKGYVYRILECSADSEEVRVKKDAMRVAAMKDERTELGKRRNNTDKELEDSRKKLAIKQKEFKDVLLKVALLERKQTQQNTRAKELEDALNPSN